MNRQMPQRRLEVKTNETLQKRNCCERTPFAPSNGGAKRLLYANGRIRHTLPVVAIHEQMEDFIRFETAKAEYHLSLSPFPGAASAMLPAKLAMAA